MDDNPHRHDDRDEPRPVRPGLWSARRWFAAMGFPLIILAAVLAWEGYRLSSETSPAVPRHRVTLYYGGALVSFAIGIAAVRARHRSDA